MIMKMAMRVQKHQVPSLYRYTNPGSTTFKNRDFAIMAGYTSFVAAVVGAAGGACGTRTDATNPSVTQYNYSSGGGGGSSKIIQGLLSDLSSSQAVVVGAAGTNGVPATGQTLLPEQNGGRGGNSQFSTAIGYGGYGGIAQQGGRVGGSGANPDGSAGPAGGGQLDAPQEGSWDAGTMSGSGGGGGAGRISNTFGTVFITGQTGGRGAVGGDSAQIGYGSASPDSYLGGFGGGANVQAVTGTSEQYGGDSTKNGVVAIKLS